MLRVTSLAIVSCLITGSAFATPIVLTDAQMDEVVGGSFVCPVITTDAVMNSPYGGPIADGDYTIAPPSPELTVPINATNTLDNGTSGSPGGAHASPGDTGYTAIWYR
jgi:hypothetical protein